MVHRVAQCFGRIDVAVNAASISGPKLGIVEYPAEPWCNVTDTNLHGTYFVCREVLPWMIRQHTGSIINITSALTTTSQAQGGACAVSQHAIEGLTKVLASELRDSGVRVNTVDIDEPTSHPGTAQADSGWTNAFLWLAGDESAARNGEHIRAADFARPA
jgi:NAD(P)-dependent dehydrogenase (short-subunit alcohol dehydrogenase family)